MVTHTSEDAITTNCTNVLTYKRNTLRYIGHYYKRNGYYKRTNVLTYKRYTLYYKRIPHEVVISCMRDQFGVDTPTLQACSC